jgi:hypothetical protein
MSSQSTDEVSERTPLLANATTAEPATTTPRTPQNAPPLTETPLPKGQIALLSFTRIAEPLTFAILFPFVNAMVLNTGQVKVSEVGYYVGAIESMFSLVQMTCSTYFSLVASYKRVSRIERSDPLGVGSRQVRA